MPRSLITRILKKESEGAFSASSSFFFPSTTFVHISRIYSKFSLSLSYLFIVYVYCLTHSHVCVTSMPVTNPTKKAAASAAPSAKAKTGASSASPSPPSANVNEGDPMLQGTYLQDDARDFPASSKALDEFEARLATGEPVHSPKAGGVTAPRAPRPSDPSIATSAKAMPSGGQGRRHTEPTDTSGAHHSQQQQQPTVAGNGGDQRKKSQCVDEEVQAKQAERQQDIDEVRQLPP